MSSKQETVTVAARVSSRLKEALDQLANQLGLTSSKLGRAAVRLYLGYPPTTMADYELARLAKRFPNNETRLMSIALSQEEAGKLRELANKLKKSLSHALTLALGNVFTEPHSKILEESYAMGTPKKPYPGEAYGRAVEAGIVNPSKPADASTNNPCSSDPSQKVGAPDPEDFGISLGQLAVIGTLAGIPMATIGLWLAANWNELQKGLAEFFHTAT